MRIHPTSLILSTIYDSGRKIDGHIEPVVAQMSNTSLPFICDYTRYGIDYTASLTSDGILTLQLYSGDEVYFDNLSTLWFRRPQPFTHHMLSRLDIAKYVYKEQGCFWRDATELLMQNTTIHHYNHHHSERSADNKYTQQFIAREVGLQTAEMIITSSAVDFEAFAEKHPNAIIKLLHTFESNQVFWQPTKKITKDMFNELSKLYVAPIIVQEFIDGIYDYRITVIDEHIIAARYAIGESRYPYDVRIDRTVKAEKCSVDTMLASQLLQFMKKANLRYGAFDFRENKQGELVFIELNPSGGFTHVDDRTGSNIAGIMANALSATHNGKARYDLSITNSKHTFTYDTNCLPFAACAGETIPLVMR